MDKRLALPISILVGLVVFFLLQSALRENMENVATASAVSSATTTSSVETNTTVESQHVETPPQHVETKLPQHVETITGHVEAPPPPHVEAQPPHVEAKAPHVESKVKDTPTHVKPLPTRHVSHSFDSRGTGDGKGFYWNNDALWMPPPQINFDAPPPVVQTICYNETVPPQQELTLPRIPVGPVLVMVGIALLMIVVLKQSRT